MNRLVKFIIIVAVTFTAVVVGILLGATVKTAVADIQYIERAEPEPTVVSAEDFAARINQERAKAGVHGLSTSEELNASACAKADDILKRQYWSHYAPDGQAPWELAHQFNYWYTSFGENLLLSAGDEAQGIQAWMDSQTHRDNLLSGKYVEQGMCVRTGTLLGKNYNVVVNHFGHR